MLVKLRGKLSSEEAFSLQITDEMSAVLKRLWDMRSAAGPEPWWGLQVTVTPDGKPTLQLDQDPNCAVDPMWFKS